jgi:hypothetical protein
MSRQALGKGLGKIEQETVTRRLKTLLLPKAADVVRMRKHMEKIAARELAVVDKIQAIRARNNRAWMDILRVAMKTAPQETRKLLAAITTNDKQISRLSARLAAGGGRKQ